MPPEGGTANQGSRRGYSLLEVILALAILAGSIAVLSEVSGLGMRNARWARDLTYAQLLCESKMAEIAAGLESAEAQEDVPLGTVADATEPDWLCTVELEPAGETGLVRLSVTVHRDLPVEQRPARFTLVRWIPDPSSESEEEAAGGGL